MRRSVQQLAAQALWLALGVRVALALVCVVFAHPMMELVGGAARLLTTPRATCA